jgi:hypothetical protein
MAGRMTDQLDLFADPAEVEHGLMWSWLFAEAMHYWRQRRKVRPDTGLPLLEDFTWCGRCGETVREFELVNNHDLGYCGCPTEVDPTWKLLTDRRPDGRGWRGGAFIGRTGQLTEDELCDRWDRQYIPDCERCGHPWGVHSYGQTCTVYCGCRIYRGHT